VLRFWKMLSIPRDGSQKGSLKSSEAEKEEFDFSKALDRPRSLYIERQRSCDERSLSELSVGFSPRHLISKIDISSRLAEHVDHIHSPLSKSGINTPRSAPWESHSLTSEAWEALRRSLVYFRGRPVGTIAALDNSDEQLNYDQVARPCHILAISFSLFLGIMRIGTISSRTLILATLVGHVFFLYYSLVFVFFIILVYTSFHADQSVALIIIHSLALSPHFNVFFCSNKGIPVFVHRCL